MMRSYRRQLLATSLLVGASLAMTGAAHAQASTAPQASSTTDETGQTSTPDAAKPDSTGDIVVTGSLIRDPNLVSASPVTSVGQDEIQLRQSNTAEEILRDLPGAVPSIGSAVNNGNGGASFVDLRGLGSTRNVVLLDGNRIAPAGLAGRVDLNNIPLALVERADTLTGGAATTYGADAVAGVVNFITRSNFSGVDAQISNQITERGDGKYFRGDLTIGGNFDEDKGNVVFSVGYQNSDPVYQGDRGYSLNNIDSFSGTASGSGTSIPSRFTRPGSATQQINTDTGALVPTYALFNFNPYNIFQTPFRRYNMYGAGHYDISDSIEVYTRGLFSKNTVQTIVAPSGIFSSSLVIPYSNPYLPAAARAQFCASNGLTTAQCTASAAATSPFLADGKTANPDFRTFTTTVLRRTTEVGPRISNFSTTIFDYRGGVKVGITDSLKLDVSAGYGESENRQTLQNYVLTSRVRAAVYATNTTTCLANAPGGAASTTAGSGCVPLNIFGPQGSITSAMIPYITGESTTTIRTSLLQTRALLTGDLPVTSPFASSPIGFAAGAEYRKYFANQRSDTLAQTAGELGGAGGAAPNEDGGYEVTEGYGEINAPLVTDKPFFQSLSLEAGVRYSHYKVFAANSPKYNTTTYKGGGAWEPVTGVKLRGTYQRAVRAPNIAELFAPQVTGLTNLASDPCASFTNQGARKMATPTGDLAAVCLAQGATQANLANIQDPTGGQANATGGGNLNLKPEISDSFTGGVVLQPTSLVRGLSISVDYYNIKVTGAVSSPGPQDVLDACFKNLTAASATSAACTSIRRNPVNGQLDGDVATTPGLPLVLSNLGLIKTSGIDLGFNYSRNIGVIKFSGSFTGNYTIDSKFKAVPTSGLYRNCVGFYSVNCPSIQPQLYWNARGTFGYQKADFSVLWRHISSNRYEPAAIDTTTAATTAATTPAAGFGRIPAYNYIDFAVRYSVNENFDFTLTMTNAFDKAPPLVGSTVGSTLYNSGNTYPSTYDPLGRRFAVSGRLRF